MKLTLNLASRPYLNRRALRLTYAVIGALLLVLLLAQLNFWLQSNRQETLLQTRIGDLEQELGIAESGINYTPEQFEALSQRIAFSNDLIQKESFRWTVLLDKLEGVMTDNARITAIKPEFKAGNLTLDGQCKSVADLRKLLDSLIASADFRDVYLLSQAEGTTKLASGLEQKHIVFRVRVQGVLK